MYYFNLFKTIVPILGQVTISVLTISYFSDIDIPIWQKVISIILVNLFYFLALIIYDWAKYHFLKDEEDNKDE